jgi:hypothetical protein
MDLRRWLAEVADLEMALGLPEGFTRTLVGEDDWSFVIRSHALVESAVTHLLSQVVDPRLSRVFRAMPLGGGRASRLACIDALAIFDSPTIEFVRRLSDLRDRLLHDVADIRFSLADFFAGLSPGERCRWATVLAGTLEGTGKEGALAELTSLFEEHPKHGIGLAVHAVLARTVAHLQGEGGDGAAAGPEVLLRQLVLSLVGAHPKGRKAAPAPAPGRAAPVLTAR